MVQQSMQYSVCVCVCVCVCVQAPVHFLVHADQIISLSAPDEETIETAEKTTTTTNYSATEEKEYKTLGWRIFYGTGISVWPFSSLVQNQNFNEQFPRRWWKIWDILNAILGHECH